MTAVAKASQSEYPAKAAAMWLAFDNNQRAAVRFGMFPAGPMREAEKLGYQTQPLAVELMSCAKKNGGMFA